MASTTTLGLHAPIGADPYEPSTAVALDKLTDPTDVAILAAQLDLLIPQPGFVQMHAARFAPAGWLLADGSAVSRSTYSRLFTATCQQLGTVTATIATPGVLTSVGHWLVVGDAVYLTTTGALPTGLTVNTRYFVAAVTANTFTLSATLGGGEIATSGSQSGVHTLTTCPYGLGDGTTTFNVPDLRGRVPVMIDGSAGRLTASDVLGQSAGAEKHTLTESELPAHNHDITLGVYSYDPGAVSTPGFSGTPATGATADAGGGAAHNNMPPYLVVNWLVKT